MRLAKLFESIGTKTAALLNGAFKPAITSYTVDERRGDSRMSAEASDRGIDDRETAVCDDDLEWLAVDLERARLSAGILGSLS